MTVKILGRKNIFASAQHKYNRKPWNRLTLLRFIGSKEEICKLQKLRPRLWPGGMNDRSLYSTKHNYKLNVVNAVVSRTEY